MNSLEASARIFEHVVSLRRQLHRQPELAFEEAETAEQIMAELDRLGIPYDYGGVGGGVVGRLDSGPPGAPVVALRAEMDALPGAENTDLPFASTIEGKMHACGHDAHMAMVLGAASLLAAEPPPGKVLFVFQPAEERGGGARVVLRSGALREVAAIFGGHVTNHYAVGEIMVADGVITAQSDRFTIEVRGKGGHGARPHEAIDAIVIASLLVTSIQTLVSRVMNPVHPSVVTVGTISAGSAANVIADHARLEGSIRTTWPPERDRLHQSLHRMVAAIGAVHDAKIDLEIQAGYPPVINTHNEAQIAHRAAQQVVGEAGLVALDHPSMGSEDFSFFLQEIPGCYVRLGARDPARDYTPLHSPSFNIHEGVLRVGTAFFDAVARQAIADLAVGG
jgi:amidohydrolase